jgi:putative FmdB family regulatory protein
MPIYEYRCDACGHELEAIQKFSDAVLKECPACNQPALKKLMSSAGFQLKGSGWYATDFKKTGGKEKTKEEAKDKPKEESKEKTKDKGDTKAGGCGSGSCGCAH